jgi:asparagine synthase (glutamine-hydrolysing)
MCGIAGYWNHASGRPAERGTLGRMVDSLVHRGPDEDGAWIEGDLAIGMRRLRVIDPEGGHQPMRNEDGTVQGVFNGEIYNHRELRRELEGRGHRFRTRSDTEAIVHAYEEWGAACVERFNGMFAIAVWDSRAQRLLLARDRLGIKPLYVYQGPEGVVFGSELKAVIAAPWVPLDWDLEAVDDFVVYEYIPAPRSVVRNVCKLPAGTTLLLERGGSRTPRPRRFWTLSAGACPPSNPEAAAEELRERLQASVRRRLLADVPLGAFLSGGIDSSIIVALMARESPGRVRSFSLGFADRSYNELPYSRLVAQQLGTTHREELATPEIVGLASRLAGHFDEPFGDVSAFPTFMISELARREVTVALSGDGGDELFAGYDHYRAHRWAHRIRGLSRHRPWRLVEALLQRVPPAATKKGLVNKAKRFVEGAGRPADLEHARWWLFADLAERAALYRGPLADAAAARDPFGFYRERLAEGADHGFSGLQRQLYSDVTGYLADDILVKVDRMSMALSLEARVPFLDHEVVELAMRIPDAWKIRNGESKWILKQAFRDLLPDPVRRRSKEGFSMPMKNWLRGPLRPLLDELLDPRRIEARGWFDAVQVGRLVREHCAGRANHAHRLWCLMSLELSLDVLAARRQQSRPSTRPVDVVMA